MPPAAVAAVPDGCVVGARRGAGAGQACDANRAARQDARRGPECESGARAARLSARLPSQGDATSRSLQAGRRRLPTACRPRYPGDAAASAAARPRPAPASSIQEAEQIARQLVARRTVVLDYGLLGDALMEQGRLAEAADAYQRMIDLKPFYQSYTRAAHVRWTEGRPRTARSVRCGGRPGRRARAIRNRRRGRGRALARSTNCRRIGSPTPRRPRTRRCKYEPEYAAALSPEGAFSWPRNSRRTHSKCSARGAPAIRCPNINGSWPTRCGRRTAG